MKLLPTDHPIFRRYLPGHGVCLLKDGTQAFPAMLEAIRKAKDRICFETYIFKADKTGEKFASALIERAQAGVQVRLLYDAMGSFGLPSSFLEKLRQGSVKAAGYSPLFPWFGLAHLNRRNHRKSLIVDGRIGFVGGINIADEYAPMEEGGGGWRDTHLRIEGKAAQDLENLFFHTWYRTSKESKQLRPGTAEPPVLGNVFVRILGSRSFRERRMIRAAYLRAIDLAESKILITSAYFLPDPILIRALKRAAKRGVQISVIIGGTTSDVPWVGYAGYAIFGKLLRRGIKIYDWKQRVLHAKTAVVDGVWSTVGSYNLDYRSLLHNLEVNAGIFSGQFGKEMEAMFEEDLKQAKAISYEEWKNRSWLKKTRDWIAYRFRFLL